MGESLLLITIITLVVLTVRRARPVVLNNPVVIQRPGQYHITLAPQLNQAQNFIESIAKQFAELPQPQGDIPAQYFEVRDSKVFAKGESCYLLAVAFRSGMLYFQAVNPDADSHHRTVYEFSEAVLAQHPLSGHEDEQGAEKLCGAVEAVAGQLNIVVKVLPASD